MITEEKINTEELLAITDDKAGAIVTFFGAVRNHNLGEGVDYLEYEAYVPMGNKMIAKILADAKERWGLHQAACVHRIGKVGIGELAVAVITLASHRKEAYEANEYIINTVKAEVPIWKKEYFSDGKVTWSDNDNKETKTL
ncbi:MAG: molybdenum cofactor biosynthesis protein MoaE [Cyclobacteriaceae bacterium]